MQVTLNFFEMYFTIAVIVAAVVYSGVIAGYITSVYNWYEIYVSGEKVPSEVNGARIFGIQFCVWANSEYGESMQITPATAVLCAIPFIIGGAFGSIVFGATWILSVPIRMFVCRAKAKRASNCRAIALQETYTHLDPNPGE